MMFTSYFYNLETLRTNSNSNSESLNLGLTLEEYVFFWHKLLHID